MSVFLSPVGGAGAQFFDNNGNPLTGGKLYTYAAATTTPQATYTGSTGSVFHTNPIVLDAAGRVPGSGEIWLADSAVYKFVLKTSDNVLLATWDQLTGVNSNFVNYTAETEIQTATAGQTVFVLTTMTYNPGTGNLTVFVDGVNQYEGESYLETDGTTVTFVAGLHVGAKVKFTTAVQTTGNATDASVVTYAPPFAGSVGTTVEAKLAQTVSVKDFGAVGDGVTDDTAAIQSAINSGATIIDLVGLPYAISSKVIANTPNQTLRNGTLTFIGDHSTRLLDVTANSVSVENVIFDANNKQPRSSLVFVDSNIDSIKFLNCTFKDMQCVYNGTNVLNQTYALLISPYAVTNFEIIGCVFKNLTKYNDGVNGTPIAAATVGLGFIGGICFLPEDFSIPSASQPIPTAGIVAECTFDNIQTIKAAGLSIADQADFDDADAIRTYGQAGGATELNVHVSDCVFRNVSKRAFKFRASGSTADNCVIYADGMQYGMICPIDATANAHITNIKIHTSSAKPVQKGFQWSLNADAGVHKYTAIRDLYVSHAIVGGDIFSDVSATPLQYFELSDAYFNQCSAYGLSVSSVTPSTQSDLVFKNINVYGSGNNCAGIYFAPAADNKSGVKIDGAYIENASIRVQGDDQVIRNVEQVISNSSYAGKTTSDYLFIIEGKTSSSGIEIDNYYINAYNLNTSFVNATRTLLGIFAGDGCAYKNIRIKVPEGLDTTYSHCEFWGSNWILDGYTYNGLGRTNVCTTVAGTRWAIKNAYRMNSNNAASTASAFLYTNNVNTGNGLFENITDFCTATGNTITINNGLGAGNRFIVTNVSSKTSGTIVQSGGLATVVNAINFP